MTRLEKYLNYLEQDKGNINLLLDVVHCYLELHDFEHARQYLTQAKAIDRNACFAMEGVLFLGEGDTETARTCFNQAMQYNDDPALRYKLAFTHFIMDEFSEAIKILEPLLTLNDPKVIVLQARIFHALEQFEDAIDILSHSLKQHGKNGEILGFLSLVYLDNDDLENAEKYAKKSLQISPEMYEARLVEIMTRSSEKPMNVHEIESLINIQPEDPRLWFALGNYHLQAMDITKAASAFEKSMEFYPNFHECMIVLAWCKLLDDQLDDALKLYHDATVVSPEISEGYGGLSLIYALKEQTLEAKYFMDKALELDEDSFLAKLAQTIYFLQSKPEKAKQQFDGALGQHIRTVSEKIENAILLMETDGVVH